MERQETSIPESGTLSQSDARWAEARRRAAILGPLADSPALSGSRAAEAGEQLGLTARTIYTLMRHYKQSGGSLLSLAPAPSAGGRGRSRLSAEVEHIVATAIATLYLTRQRVKIETVVKTIRQRCRTAGLSPPASNTIQAGTPRRGRAHPRRTRGGSSP